MVFKKGMLYGIADIKEAEKAESEAYKTGFLYKLEEALKGGLELVQLRYKKPSSKELLYECALKAFELAKKYNTAFIVNDYIELAKEIEADGIHLGQEDIKTTGISEVRRTFGVGKIIGVTAKTFEFAKKAQELGADYIGSGAVFATVTKEDAQSMGLAELKRICESLTIPVFAIGGINISNLAKLRELPITGVAIAGGIFNTDEVRNQVLKLREALADWAALTAEFYY